MSTIAAPDARGAARSTQVRGIILHPGVLFVLLWTAVLGIWALMSEETFVRLTLSEKYVSGSAVAFFLASIMAFALGTIVGPAMFRAERPARLAVSSVPPDAARALARGTQWIFVIGAATALYLIAAGAQRAGGFTALLDEIVNGGSWSILAEEYFEPARIALITVWVHLIVAVGPLAAVAAVLAPERRMRSRMTWILGLGLLLALLISFAFAERLIAFAYVVASAVAGTAASRARRAPGARISRGALMRLVAVGVLLIGFWIASEFSRTYLATRESTGPVSVTDVNAGTPLAAQRFLAYVITSTNNGMYGVDHFESRQYVYNSLSALFTASGLDTDDTPIVGPGNVERTELLTELYPDDKPLTTFSLPGMAFQDVGWGAIIVMFWLGAAIGAVYARFRHGELWAIFVYALCVVGILDSFRILYWGRTEMVVPTLAIVVLMTRVYAAAKQDPGSRRVSPTVDTRRPNAPVCRARAALRRPTRARRVARPRPRGRSRGA